MAFGPLPDWYNRFNVEPAEAPESAQPRLRQEDEPMLWCPVCSSRLISHKCKLLCQKCGYYMSCADYY
jgi:hypothetical protein